MTETITVSVLKGAIPAACFRAGGLVVAQIVLIEDLTALDMAVTAIVEGEGDTDEVTFEYEGDFVPAGVVLAACNLSSFQCRCDCCSEKRYIEFIGPDTEVTDGNFFVGFLPGDMIVDQAKVYAATATAETFTLSVFLDGVLFFEATVDGTTTVVSRSEFSGDFADTGWAPEDSRITATVAGAPTGDDAWSGLAICLLGRWFTP